MSKQQFFVVRVDGLLWPEVQSLDDLQRRGLKTQEARHKGEYDVFTPDGLRKVATLFLCIEDAKQHSEHLQRNPRTQSEVE